MGIGLVQTPVTITSGTALSAAVAFGDKVPVGIAMPAGWDAAALTFQASCDGGTTWNELYDTSGNAVSYTVAASRYIPLDPGTWVGINHIKVRSGTSGSAVNQTADRVLTFVSRF